MEDNLQHHEHDDRRTSCKVLLLDDDSTSSSRLSQSLRDLGCEVSLVSELDMFVASSVIARVAKERFDLVLVSTIIDSREALSICDRIRKDPRSMAVPVVALHAHAADEQDAVLAKALPWLPRPAANSHTRLTAASRISTDDLADLAARGDEGLGSSVDALLRDIADAEAREGLRLEITDRDRKLVRLRQSLDTVRAARDRAVARARETARRAAHRGAELFRSRERAELGEAARSLELLQAEDRHARDRARLERARDEAVARALAEAAEGVSEELDRALAKATAEISIATAARADLEQQLISLRAGHKEELVQLDESIAHLLDRERTAATKRLAEPNDAVGRAVSVALGNAKRVAETELTVALEEAARAHAVDLETARLEVRGSLDHEVRQRRALEADLLALRTRVANRDDAEEKLRRKLEAERIERETAIWRVTQEAIELVEDERARTASTLKELEAKQTATLRSLELELIASERATATLRAAHAAELAQIDDSVARMLEQERAEHDRAIAIAGASAEQRLQVAARSSADVENLQRELRASRATREDLSRARDALMDALDAQRRDHAAALDRAAEEAQARIAATEAELADQAARNAQLFAAHRHEAGRAQALAEALRSSLATHTDLTRERDALRRWLEVERAEHAAALANAEAWGEPPSSRNGASVAGRTTKPPPDVAMLMNTTPPPTPELHTRPPRTSTRRSVLVIDRDVLVRTNVSRALAREGCAITARESCAGIAGRIADYDLIVTEVANVAIDELLQTLTGQAPACEIIAWTSSTESARALFGAAGAVVSVLEKGMRPDALVAAVRASLA